MTKEQRHILRGFYALLKEMPDDFIDNIIETMFEAFQEMIKTEFPEEWKEYEERFSSDC